jgi:quercetin dioxygenase-like cupin family protein
MSRIHRFTGDKAVFDYRWDGVQPKEYTNEEIKGVFKHVLVGPEDNAPNFIIRYFNVPVGKTTSYDQHLHEHGVVILHGQAKVQINDNLYTVGPMDSLFISGNDIHQFTNIGETPLGFICVITKDERR